MKWIIQDKALVARHNGETIRMESWGRDSVRIRTTLYPGFTGHQWALLDVENHDSDITISETEARLTNGRISVWMNANGVMVIEKDGKPVLKEYFRNYDGTISKEARCLKYISRDYKPWLGGDYRIRLSFESNANEKLFGMGQYQQENTNLKGCVLDLEQRNSQVSVPFLQSSLGYGFLWNNPATGRVIFGMNKTEWQADCSKELDYWITVGDNPKEILEKYTSVSGRAPAFPSDLLGLWQCKLRYRTQEEVLSVAHACKQHNVPIDVIVIDFFHWTYQGDWKFDPIYWPDPKAMVEELHAMGIKVCVSVWPSVDKRSENYQEMWERGYLIRTERGGTQTYDYQGDCTEIDATNPEARAYVWNICKKNYADLGIDMFWLDNGEPDFVKYDFDQYRYQLGPAMSCSNIYPQYYSRLFYDNQVQEGWEKPMNLLRSAWAGSQRYGNVVWSGDVPSTFESLRDQLHCGINMGLAGIPWWTTDIGGFMTDDAQDPAFQELLIRWFEFATFSAVLRLHGERGPKDIAPLDNRDWGGGYLHTGHANELWSYGEENFAIMKKYLDIRHSLKSYLEETFVQASIDGSPILRAMFYEFAGDETCWNLYDQFMFGQRYLIAPILQLGQRERQVYLPEGTWRNYFTQEVVEGKQTILVQAPLDEIPVFERIR